MRNPYFDNARLILIFLVVLGHLIEKTSLNNPFLYNVYVLIYLFHIPAFTLLSGYFSKNLSNTKQKVKKLLIYFIVFEIFYIPLSVQSGYIFLIKPYWHMWFLLSLISWNIILPYAVKLKHPIVIAFIIGIMSGYFDFIGYILSLSRTLVFFPFFLIGYYLKESDFNKLNTLKFKVLSIFSVLIILPLINKLPYHWFYGSISYATLGYTEWYAGFYRLCIYSINALLCVAFLALVPRKQFTFTYIGLRTLNIYLLHGIFVLIISIFFNNIHPLLLLIVTIIFTAFLSSNVTHRTITLILNPIFRVYHIQSNQTPESPNIESRKNY